MRNHDPFKNFDRNFNRMRTLFWVMFSLAAIFIVGAWVAMVYLAVTKGPATLERTERFVDAVTESVERSNRE